MTTHTIPAIVPAMSHGVPVQTDPDERDVPTVPALSLVKDRDVPGRPDADEQDVPGHPGTVDNDVPGHPDADEQDVPGHPGTVDNDVPGHPGTVEQDSDPDERDVPAATADDTGTSRAVALEGMSKAAIVRHVFDTIATPTTAPTCAQVTAWLEAHQVTDIDPAYVRRIVRAERTRRGLSEDTTDLPALTPAVLADLDAAAEQQAAPAAASEVPAEVPAAAEPEPEAAADLVPVPADASPATAELAARVREARARLPLQAEDALLAALSDEELERERALAEAEREARREIRRRRMAAELATAQREQATAEAIAKSEAADARWLQRAHSKRRRLTSEDAKLAALTRNATWSSWALIAMVGLGMAWSAVNAQKNLVPSGDMSDPLYWLSYGVEAMISVPLIVIMVASTTASRWGRALPRAKVIPAELALLGLTLLLNVGPHVHSGDAITLFKYGLAPVMVGVLLQVHAQISAHYADLIAASGSDDRATGAR